MFYWLVRFFVFQSVNLKTTLNRNKNMIVQINTNNNVEGHVWKHIAEEIATT
jgi:hypothetical protein